MPRKKQIPKEVPEEELDAILQLSTNYLEEHLVEGFEILGYGETEELNYQGIDQGIDPGIIDPKFLGMYDSFGRGTKLIK